MLRRSFLLLCLGVFLLSPVAEARRRGVGATETIVIGGLFSLAGDGASLGKASEAALDLAVRDLNLELGELDLPYRVQAVVVNTGLTPAGALEGIKALHAAGATIVVGPQSSAEAAAVVSYANTHDILLISQASTASTLAIANDNLFRLAPNDRLEGAALAALLRADGVDVLVPLWRTDAGQTGLRDNTSKFFVAAGGTALPGVSYAPTETNFSASVTALGNAIRAAKNAYPGKKLAIFLAAFEEGAEILDLARLDADLKINWYSGDGLTQSQAVLSTPAIAAFAAATKFTAPAVALSEQTRDRWEPVSAAIHARVGYLPDAFSLSVYDAAVASVWSAVKVRNDRDTRILAFVRDAQRHWGITGPLALDAAGDRRIADFDFWTVMETGTAIDWVRTSSYSAGRLVR
jgi:branched-chain amino acid transport system substrate-binding protein